jgi:hypothetical protein
MIVKKGDFTTVLGCICSFEKTLKCNSATELNITDLVIYVELHYNFFAVSQKVTVGF